MPSSPQSDDAITPKICRQACEYAIRVSEELSSYSKLNDGTDSIPLIQREEVVLGDMLGQGGFNQVFEVKSIDLFSNSSNSGANDDLRKQLVKRAHYHSLAIKFLNATSSEDYCNGAADLLLETKYLASISAFYPHPNILRLHAIAAAGPQGFETVGGYFLIFDKLVDTLDKRLEVWKELERRKRINLTREHEYHLKALFVKRLLVGCDLISAIQHLHKLRIIFRDLKPDNVGFDGNGVLKLFDFGLAKELDPRQKTPTSPGKYDMSGATGSRRYMAPEVANNEPYGLSADVYSLAINVWEVMSLEKAYWEMSLSEHRELVIQGDVRPPLPNQWSLALQSLLQSSWHVDAAQRPPTVKLQSLLREEIEGYAKENEIYIPPKGRQHRQQSSVSPPPRARVANHHNKVPVER